MQNELINKALHEMSIRQNDATLLHTFIEEGMEFVVIGGVATQFYGCRKWDEVDDLDLLLNPTEQNVKKLFSSLAKLKINASFEISDVTKPKVQLRIKDQLYNTELLTPSKEQDFASVYDSSMESGFDHHIARIISKDDLIKMKEDVISNTEYDLEKHNKDLECLNKQ